MSNNKGASKEAIQYHYDVGNDFYQSWLDERMIYSAAIWPDDVKVKCTLEDAQIAKLDWHIASAGLKEGDRLLDVGCGWGGLMRRAVETRGLSSAFGLTLAEEQAAWIAANHADHPISAAVCPWQELKADQPFNGIISIGAFEHFAKPDMDRAAKVQAYSDFFRCCADNLVDGGRLSLQTIIWMDIDPEKETSTLPLHIFPESNLPHTSEIIEAAAPWFHLEQFHNRPLDYSRTLREWVKRMRNDRKALGESYGPDTVKRYSEGFIGFIFGFGAGVIGLTRSSFVKRPR